MDNKVIIPANTRIIIIEGIAGAGKSTIISSLLEQFKKKDVYIYKEEEQLMSWKHINLKKNSKLRLELLHSILDEIKQKITSNSQAIFILERFHITTKIFAEDTSTGYKRQYALLIKKLKNIRTHIIIPTIQDSEIEKRSSHKERGAQWREYLALKLKKRGFENIGDMYKAEQDLFLQIAKEQKIPYTTITVKAPTNNEK